MTVDDTLLMSYADGDLPAARRQEIEAAVAESPDLAERLAALRASVLPYTAAFDRQNLPPLPEKLATRIDDLTRVSTASNVIAFPARQWPRTAAAFAAGVFCFGVASQLWFYALPARSTHTLVQAVADYHALYARETVLNLAPDPKSDQATLASAREVDGLPVRVPDLRSAGLEFKRVQRLRFNDKALIQIVYLPERGDPVALCVTADAGTDQGIRSQQLGKVAAVTWQQDHIASVLVGADSQLNLTKLGERIAQGNMPLLYGKL